MKLATSLIGLWNLGEQTWVLQLVFDFCLLCVSRIFSSIVPDASFLCALCCRVANERELLFPGNWKSARFSEFLSLSCFVFFPGFLGMQCGVVCLISCLRFFSYSSCASSVISLFFTLYVFGLWNSWGCGCHVQGGVELPLLGVIQGNQSIFVWFPMQSDHARAYELATLQAVSYYLGVQNIYG